MLWTLTVGRDSWPKEINLEQKSRGARAKRHQRESSSGVSLSVHEPLAHALNAFVESRVAMKRLHSLITETYKKQPVTQRKKKAKVFTIQYL